jgi:hypothetical protein
MQQISCNRDYLCCVSKASSENKSGIDQPALMNDKYEKGENVQHQNVKQGKRIKVNNMPSVRGQSE